MKSATACEATVVIILDANCLISLATYVPVALRTQEHAHDEKLLFLDAVLELPSCGIEVVIPEMVAFEIAGTLSNYTSTEAVFFSSNRNHAILGKWFLRNRDRAPIVPLPPQSTSLQSQLMAQARRALTRIMHRA